jgi:hypothetical protein
LNNISDNIHVKENIINDNEETNIINDNVDINERASESKVDGKWVKAEELKIGDYLITEDGKKAKVTYLKKVNENTEVYNLEAKKFNDYIVAGDVVVHNSNAVQITNTQIPTRAEIDSIKNSPRKAVLDSYVEDYKVS